MAKPVILFNTGTGSDTAASGAGPATALSGTGADLDATTTVDLSVDSPDLSGVATDGSAALWVGTSSGRQFAEIVSVDDILKTVTVADAYGVTESGRNWGIGGKRNSWDNADSQTVFADYSGGWEVQTETAQPLTTAIDLSVALAGNESLRITGATEHQVITQSGAGLAIFTLGAVAAFYWENLHFKHSNATNEYAVVSDVSAEENTFRNCICGDASGGDNPKGFIRRGSGGVSGVFIDCEARWCTEDGMGNTSMRGRLIAHGSYAHDCGRHGFGTRGDQETLLTFCVSENNGGSGVSGQLRDTGSHAIINCTMHGNAADGVSMTADDGILYVFNCNLTANGGYGIDLSSDETEFANHFVDFNNFGTGSTANTSGAVNNISSGPNDLTVDPSYTDAANENFEVGTSVKAKGFPDSARNIGADQSSTVSYVDIGAAQREEPSGGGGETSHVFAS